MPKLSEVQKARDRTKAIKQQRTKYTLRTYSPTGSANKASTPVMPPYITHFNKAVQGIKSINKIKNKRFR
jgi:hypothetical protein